MQIFQIFSFEEDWRSVYEVNDLIDDVNEMLVVNCLQLVGQKKSNMHKFSPDSKYSQFRHVCYLAFALVLH